MSVERNSGLCRFVLLRSVIGLENPRHTLDQTDAKVNSVANVSPVFTRASGHFLLFNVSFLWPLKNFVLFRVVPMKFVLRSVVGHENLRHNLDQSDAK